MLLLQFSAVGDVMKNSILNFYDVTLVLFLLFVPPSELHLSRLVAIFYFAHIAQLVVLLKNNNYCLIIIISNRNYVSIAHVVSRGGNDLVYDKLTCGTTHTAASVPFPSDSKSIRLL